MTKKSVTLKFQKNLPHQIAAVQSTLDLFVGSPTANDYQFGKFEYKARQGVLSDDQTLQNRSEQGIANRLNLTDEELLRNLHAVQDKNVLDRCTLRDLRQDNMLEYDIEMETGTGKTYVYLRTIMALNKRYGWNKFIILVPSRAIRAGVFKSLDTTKAHFKNDFTGDEEFAEADFYKMESRKGADNSLISKTCNFATRDRLSIMVLTNGLFNSPGRVMRKAHELLGGFDSATQMLSECRPIVIVDEPQMNGAGGTKKTGSKSKSDESKTREALKLLNPLFVLHYSATHRVKHASVYSLGPVDSFRQNLVKRIVVVHPDAPSINEMAPIRLVSCKLNKDNQITAALELDVLQKTSVKHHVSKTLMKNDRLESASNNEAYGDLYVANISVTDQCVELSDGRVLKANADDEDMAYKRVQIHETIKKHLDNELKLLGKGIKVLSLFFIDKVEHYLDAQNQRTGVFAQYFEQEYAKLIAQPKYAKLRERWGDSAEDIKAFHNGYFAKDKSGKVQTGNTEENSNDDDKDFNAIAIKKILEDKEKLLSTQDKLRFIFSHSALQAGWDNPNVFQICTLADNPDPETKHQRIGRGLRLPVNQSGERIQDSKINELSVITNESYDAFAKDLQTVYEKNGIVFGRICTKSFAGLLHTEGLKVIDKDGTLRPVSAEDINRIAKGLIEEGQKKEHGWIDKYGKPTDKLKQAIEEDKLPIPEDFAPIKHEIIQILKKECKECEGISAIVKDGNNTRTNEHKKDKEKPFEAIWQYLKLQTAYNVEIDTEKLIREAAQDLVERTRNWKPGYSVEISNIIYDEQGISAKPKANAKGAQVEDQSWRSLKLPDIITRVSRAAHITRQTVADIILAAHRMNGSNVLNAFQYDPLAFVELTIRIVRGKLQTCMSLSAKQPYYIIPRVRSLEEVLQDQTVDITRDNLCGPEAGHEPDPTKSFFPWVQCDSKEEVECIESFEAMENVKFYMKLPREFTISVPQGKYNPDWAIIVEEPRAAGEPDPAKEKLLFVFESKGTDEDDESPLRMREEHRLHCVPEHFAAIAPNGEIGYFWGKHDTAEKNLK